MNLQGNEEEFFTEETVELFKMYSEKMTRLAQETQILREYADAGAGCLSVGDRDTSE